MSSPVQSLYFPHYDPLSSNVFARCTKSLVSWWLFRLVWWLARSWAPVTDCEAYVFTPSMLAGSRSYPDRLGLIPAAKPSLFNPVRLGRVCLLARWNIHEDEGKTFFNPGQHWRPGRQSSAFDTEPRLLWHISETLSMKCVIIQTNSDTVLKRQITIKQIAAFLCFLTDLDFFKFEELSSSRLTDTQCHPFT